MQLKITPLEKALKQLEKSFDFLSSELGESNADLREQFRSATIQAFEFTYEISVKMIRRQLVEISANTQDVHEMDFMQLMRFAQDAGLISDVQKFRTYREMRNITSHSYDEDKAERILETMDDFLNDVRFLVKELKERNRE